MSVNGPIYPKQCYYEMDYLFYSFYWLDSLEIRLDHNSTYYRSLSKNSDVKPRISHCDSQNLQYKTHPEFWPFHRRIFKTSLYYKTRLILETRRYSLKCSKIPSIIQLYSSSTVNTLELLSCGQVLLIFYSCYPENRLVFEYCFFCLAYAYLFKFFSWYDWIIKWFNVFRNMK